MDCSIQHGRGTRSQVEADSTFLIILAVMLVAAQPVSHVFQSTSITLASPTSGTGSKFSHIVIIVMEDEGIMDISHRSPPPCQGANTPYMSRLANTYGIASQHVSLVHESLPNYVAFRGGDTFGCIDACSPLNNTNIIDRLDFAQITWKAYMEDCSGGCNGMNLGKYEPDHNPFVRFQDILNNTERCNRIVNTGTGDNAILRDLTSDETAPNYAWLTPNLCNNMHTACNGQPELQTGNNYLAGLVPQILNSTVFQTTNSALFITFDEGNGYCPLSSKNEDCVYTIWTGPAAKKAYGSSALQSLFITRNH